MQIILVRHGIAEAIEVDSGIPDAERQLTRKGRKQMKQVARGVRRVVDNVGCVASSPYVRAVQTAEILVGAFKAGRRPELRVVDELRSGAGADVMTGWLAAQDPDGTVVVVGHEPDLSELTGYLTTGSARAYAKFSKAGACLIDFPSTPAAGSGRLLWLLPPMMFKWIGA